MMRRSIVHEVVEGQRFLILQPPFDMSMLRVIPAGSQIVNIRRGAIRDGRHRYVYAQLQDPDGVILISATLDYIMDVLQHAVIGDVPPAIDSDDYEPPAIDDNGG